MNKQISVYEARHTSESLLVAINRLLPQLSSSAPPMTFQELEEIVTSPCTHLLVAQSGDDETSGPPSIVGALTLAVFTIPTGIRAWIEDVVVDESARGIGAGKLLVNEALGLAGMLHARTVDLTSRESRVAANAMYQAIGFEKRTTNVYRMAL